MGAETRPPVEMLVPCGRTGLVLANDIMSEGPGKGSKRGEAVPAICDFPSGCPSNGVTTRPAWAMSNGRHSSRMPSLVKMTICLTSCSMERTNHARAEALGSSLYTGPGMTFIVKSR